uniref:Zinc finger protein 385B n=1 Tax=Sparus aurata TaxID=8175 RepID=A0A671XRR6_SPAAU
PSVSQSSQGGAYSLCEVCNLQLTSSSQAQIHYNGRSHLRRVRQLQAGETGQVPSNQSGIIIQSFKLSVSLFPGSGCSAVGRALPGLIGATGPSTMMKPFLSFPVETTSPVGLFPNFNTMDPVQKAVINHTFGVTLVPKKKQVISCNVCQLRFNSDSQAEAHYRGSRHAKKLKSQENKAKPKLSISAESNGGKLLPSLIESSPPLKPLLFPSSSPLSSSPSSSREGSEPPPSSPPSATPAPGLLSSSPSPSSKASPPPAPPASSQASSQDAPLSAESEEEKAKKLLYCSLCKVAVNSLSQLEAHNAGSKHKTMLEARSGAGPIKAYPRPGAKLKNGTTSTLKGSGLQNKTFHCQICDVHVNSEIQLKQHISSRRHKDRVAGKPSKPKYSPYNKQQRSSLTVISPHFSSFPLSSEGVGEALPLSLLPLPSSPLFTASFLRPAPGPIRTSQGSILFTPY